MFPLKFQRQLSSSLLLRPSSKSQHATELRGTQETRNNCIVFQTTVSLPRVKLPEPSISLISSDSHSNSARTLQCNAFNQPEDVPLPVLLLLIAAFRFLVLINHPMMIFLPPFPSLLKNQRLRHNNFMFRLTLLLRAHFNKSP